MEKKWLVIQCEYEEQGVGIKDLLEKQGVYESHHVIICSKGVNASLNGKKLTTGDEDGLTAKEICNLRTMLEKRCNEHVSVVKTTFNRLVWPAFIVAVLIVLTWIAER